MFDLKTKVLVVDDMMTMRKFVSKSLKEVGFTDFVEAEDGNKAFAALEAAGSVGLIVSDWNMPNCSGLELLKKVRADARFAKLPFIMVTAEAEQHQIIDAVKSGVSNYVIKPFTTDTLKEKLEITHKKISGAK